MEENRMMGARGEAGNEAACADQALLYATMCVIGLPVDVYVKDGSIYSGIFHTASFDQDYGVVLKEARLTRKGSRKANVVDGSVVDTLVILSDDLAQVVAKGILFPSNGVTGNVCGRDVQSSVTDAPSSEIAVSDAKKCDTSTVDKNKIDQTRGPARNKNNSVQSFMPTKARREREERKMTLNHVGDAVEVVPGKIDAVQVSKSDEVSGASVNGRQIGDHSLQPEQDNHQRKIEFPREKRADAAHSSNSILGCCFTEAKPFDERQVITKVLPIGASSDTSEFQKMDIDCSVRPESINASSLNTAASSLVLEVVAESCSSPISTSTDMGPLHHLDSDTGSKEFKLNPGAKSFSPTSSNSPNTPGAPSVASMNYVLSSSPTIAVPPRISVPAKLPYSNITVGNGNGNGDLLQSIVGHVGSKTQPIRYAGQYHSGQAAPTYVPPNPQAVVVGRPGQHVYVYPVPHDLVQNTTAISPVSMHPLLTPHQVYYYSMHEGSGAGQPLQPYVPQPYVAGGQQPFAIPGQIPLLQPPIPPHRSNPVPGSNTFYRTKIP